MKLLEKLINVSGFTAIASWITGRRGARVGGAERFIGRLIEKWKERI